MQRATAAPTRPSRQPKHPLRGSGRLSGWALGKTSDAALLASAQTASNKVEANFYVAMKKRAGGTPDDAALKAISLAPVLDLLEVDLARELSLPALRVALPKGVTVP